MRLDLGIAVRCSDGDFGELDDIVLEPATKRVTHLVVTPHGRPGDARLVPIALVKPERSHDGLGLTATVAEAEALEALREVSYLAAGEQPEPGANRDMGIEQAEAIPFLAPDYGMSGTTPLAADPHVMISYDRVPEGDVEIRRKSIVRSSDDHVVGHVDGLLVDDADGRLTHVVLEHGHLWGKREVSIPVAHVVAVRNDEIALGLTKDEVGGLEQDRAQPPRT